MTQANATITTEAIRQWTPTQRDLFVELTRLALSMHDHGRSGEQIAKAIRQRVKRRRNAKS